MHQLSLRAVRSSHACLGIHRFWRCFRHDTDFKKPFHCSLPQLEEDNTKSLPKIRWYQQLYPGSPDRTPFNPEEDALEKEKELKARIAELEGELRGLHEEHNSTIEPLLDHLSEEDRRSVKDALRNIAPDGCDQEAVDAESDAQMQRKMTTRPRENTANDGQLAQYIPNQGNLDIQWKLPPEEAVYLQRLNTCLRKAATNVSDVSSRKELWRWYSRCKQNLPPFLHLISGESWNVLWSSQYNHLPGNPDRATHLRILSQDMISSGKDLDRNQRLVFIDSLYLEGRYREAIDHWQSQQSILQNDGQNSLEHGMLGVRLFASQGDAQKAQNIAMDLINEHGSETARVLLPVIEAWALGDDNADIQRAWALYLRLRAHLGSAMKLEDYDRITMCFLKVKRSDIALAVFKDLMLGGGYSQHGSTELYKASLGIVGSLQSESINASDLTKVSMTALTILPRRFQNKFFYGSWIKKLLGMGEADAAATVVELMYERGVKPDSKHLNGILGAWIRSKSTANKEKAEQMGWAMIRERLDFVSRRRNQLPNSANVINLSEVRIPHHILRVVPPATIETFSVLLLYYERRGMLKHVQLLKDYLPAAEIVPNSYFMNHLLYAELRRGNHLGAWQLYRKMDSTVKPDLETFACLWDCEKAHFNRLAMYDADEFPGPRTILCEMISWFSTLGNSARDAIRHDFSKDLYDQIIRCMCLAKDLEGTIVALYALKESFLFSPDQDTARMVVLQVARIGSDERRTIKKRRTRLSGSTQGKANIAKVTRVLDLVTKQRTEALQNHGINPETWEEKRQADEQLYLLAAFLRVVLHSTTPSELAVDGHIEKAAWQMGVSGVPMRDPLLST
ncbi:hypothetical protein MMC12_003094 [Toensbergia leucococca]|nr:hypothetical protein [Toensbergia leucococca]